MDKKPDVLSLSDIKDALQSLKNKNALSAAAPEKLPVLESLKEKFMQKLKGSENAVESADFGSDVQKNEEQNSKLKNACSAEAASEKIEAAKRTLSENIKDVRAKAAAAVKRAGDAAEKISVPAKEKIVENLESAKEIGAMLSDAAKEKFTDLRGAASETPAFHAAAEGAQFVGTAAAAGAKIAVSAAAEGLETIITGAKAIGGTLISAAEIAGGAAAYGAGEIKSTASRVSEPAREIIADREDAVMRLGSCAAASAKKNIAAAGEALSDAVYKGILKAEAAGSAVGKSLNNAAEFIREHRDAVSGVRPEAELSCENK